MNIFFVEESPVDCAKSHMDRHCIKMITEYGQILSTAHRVLDGIESIGLSKSGRKQKIWKLSDYRDESLYKATHINHPSTKWTRHSLGNYLWLRDLWLALLEEYTHRYGKNHATGRLAKYLINPPKNIPHGSFEQPWRAMPDDFKVGKDSLQSYRNYYNGAKNHIARWKNREVPSWYTGEFSANLHIHQ